MDPFVLFSLPIQGIKNGTHHYRFSIDKKFLSHFEGSPVEEGVIDFDVELDKRSDMMLFDFVVSGYVGSVCDRCTANIHLPLNDERHLIVKYGEAEGETEDEVVFISREASEFNLAKYLYEFMVLALPITNTYDCENDPKPPCNFEVLKFLKDENDGEDSNNPIRDALKGLSEN